MDLLRMKAIWAINPGDAKGAAELLDKGDLTPDEQRLLAAQLAPRAPGRPKRGATVKDYAFQAQLREWIKEIRRDRGVTRDQAIEFAAKEANMSVSHMEDKLKRRIR